MRSLLFILLTIPLISLGQCIVGDCQNGPGEYKLPGEHYIGNFKDGKKHGQGKCVWQDGDLINLSSYDGQWKDDRPSGYGTYNCNDYTYSGEFVFGMQHGEGIKIYTNGKKEEGRFENDKFIGPSKKNIKLEEVKPKIGCITGNCEEGYGHYIYVDGSFYRGNWSQGRKHGKGKLYDKRGKLIQEGTWFHNVYQLNLEEEAINYASSPKRTKSSAKRSNWKWKESRLYKSLTGPASEIGIISNPSNSPFGIFWLIMKKSPLGIYLSARSDFGVLSPGEWGLRDKDWIVNTMGAIASGKYKDGGHDNYTAGASAGLGFGDINLIFYAGHTWDTKHIYERYDLESTAYFSKSDIETRNGLNIGIMLQEYWGWSFQVGHDFYDFPIKLEDIRFENITFGIGYNYSYHQDK